MRSHSSARVLRVASCLSPRVFSLWCFMFGVALASVAKQPRWNFLQTPTVVCLVISLDCLMFLLTVNFPDPVFHFQLWNLKSEFQLMSVSVVFSLDHLNSFYVRDFPFKVWVGGSLISSEETKHPPRLHSHPCFLYFAVCAGSQPAIVDSFNFVATIPKALFKKGVAAFEHSVLPDFWHLCFTWHVHLWCCL